MEGAGLQPPFFAAASSSSGPATAVGARRRGAEARDESPKIPRINNVGDVSQVTTMAPAPVNLESEMEGILEGATVVEPVFGSGTATAEV